MECSLTAGAQMNPLRTLTVTLDTTAVNERDEERLQRVCAGRSVEIVHTTVIDREHGAHRSIRLSPPDRATICRLDGWVRTTRGATESVRRSRERSRSRRLGRRARHRSRDGRPRLRCRRDRATERGEHQHGHRRPPRHGVATSGGHNAPGLPARRSGIQRQVRLPAMVRTVLADRGRTQGSCVVRGADRRWGIQVSAPSGDRRNSSRSL